MRRFFKLSMLCLAVGAASACSTPETVIATENIPTAGVRFINAVPDTNAMDFRFVDIVESNAHYKIGFRNAPSTSSGVTASTQIEYKNTRAGQRHFRIFLSDTLQSVASFVLKDTTVTIEAGKLYTALMWGNARAGTMKLVFYEEVVPDPGSAVGLRVINATSASTFDVRTYASTGTVPVATTWANVAPLTRSAFVTAPVSQIRYNIQPAGGGAVLLADPLALIGQPATVDIEGTPGTTIAGSGVTAIIFPASVAGSKATSFAAPGVSFMWDRRPPRPGTT
ncbi:MAG: DUF4397 domain-containing protein [Gemmatimonadaceae bacterium]